MTENGYNFGFPDQWRAFIERHPDFPNFLDRLESFLNVAVWSPAPSGIPERLIHQLGIECGENYFEILLMSSNGYGHAAWRLVRSMYEKAVTANHFMQHPEDASRFLDWHKVTKYKVLEAMKSSTYSVMPSDEDQQKIEEDYLAVKHQFMVTACKKCKSKRMSISWSKKSLPDMAKDAGNLASMLVPAYYEALPYAHTSYFAVMQRFDAEADGYALDYGPQNKEGDRALRTAHGILLEVCSQQIEHFKKASADKLISDALQDFHAMWP